MQVALAAQAAADARRAWTLLDLADLDRSFPLWLRALRALLGRSRGRSLITARSYYAAAKGAPGPDVVVPAASDEWLDRAFGYSGPGQYRTLVDRGVPEPAAAERASALSSATAARVVLDAGRTYLTTVISTDRDALGWYRVTDGLPCGFCAMLASRGAVYKQDSFAMSDPRFVGLGEFKVHNLCGCGLAPVFSRSDPLPQANVRFDRLWREVAKGKSSDEARRAFRRAVEFPAGAEPAN